MTSEWGPLAGLVGEWEGEGGLDTAYSHSQEKVLGTPYLEKVSLKPFGPVDNGDQHLWGLDYKTAMWRGDEQNPFHTEVGYWLWDAANGQVLRSFMVPRGMVVIAGGPATADSKVLELSAERGSTTYGILSNQYLDVESNTPKYTCTVTVGDGEWSYDECTVYDVKSKNMTVQHTDKNTLKRVD